MCTEGAFYVFVVLLAYCFIVFVHSLPLRPLSRVAGDYFSDSVVCIGSSASFASFA